MVQLPMMLVREHLANGMLVRLLPNWAIRPEIIHAVFPSRRGLIPAVRSLIDHLREQFARIEENGVYNNCATGNP